MDADLPPDSRVVWHSLSAENSLQNLQTSRSGLSAGEAADRLRQEGPNLLPEAERPGPLAMFARQFADFMIVVLIAAAVVAGLIGEPIEAVAILAIVLLNAILGFAQEWRAEQAMAALRALSAPHAQVIRGGHRQDIAAADIVVGDLVWLEAGTRVPADLRIIEGAALRIEEAALTGESVPSDKDATQVFARETPLAERGNLAFCGTIVTAGRGTGVVTATGARTELGRIARLVEAAGEQMTPLQARLAHSAADSRSRCSRSAR
jgi:Ca2+-transporting ATPase